MQGRVVNYCAQYERFLLRDDPSGATCISGVLAPLKASVYSRLELNLVTGLTTSSDRNLEKATKEMLDIIHSNTE